MIRDATPADEAAWRGIWAQYLAFYEVTLPPQATDRTWARALDPLSPLTARLAVDAGVVTGFALHHWHLSTWGLGADGYLEDLFVADKARGHGPWPRADRRSDRPCPGAGVVKAVLAHG